MFIEVSESSQAGEARRKVVAYAEESHMAEHLCGAVALAVTEMATNLVKHAGKGHILVQRLQNGHSGLSVMSIDKGPGIHDIPKALSDGYSTAGSPGTGLGALLRMSDSFDLYSVPGSGTVVRTEFWNEKRKGQPAGVATQIGVVSEPIAGEDVCGDGWGMRQFADSVAFMVADGLGHGLLAADAAKQATHIFATTNERSPQKILGDVHAALKATRGAAVCIVHIDVERGLVTGAGVGNISAAIIGHDSMRSIASHNGILGQRMERVQEFTYPWERDNMLVMHSDGLATRWDLQRYPGVSTRHPSVIAAVLHRDFCRGRDDVTVLVAKTGV